MRGPRLTIAALAVLSAWPAFAADPALDSTVERYCLDTKADATGALALADADGWNKPTGSRIDIAGVAFDAGQVRIRTIGAQRFTLFAGPGELPAGDGAAARICGVVLDQGVLSEVGKRIGEQLGFPPLRSSNDAQLFVFQEKNGKRASYRQDQEDQAQEDAKRGDFSAILIEGALGKVTVRYFVATGAPAA